MEQLLKHPDSIFKYVPFSIRTLEILIKGGLWFGHPKNLNDPYEGEFLIDTNKGLPRQDVLKRFYRHAMFRLSGDELQEKIEEVKKNPHTYHQDVYRYIKNRVKEEYGVSCFTRTFSDILMWTHYADSHTGMCLVIDKELLYRSMQEHCPEIGVQDIEYEQSLINANLQVEDDRLYCQRNQEIILRKLDCWKYEKEVRFFCHFPKKNSSRWIFFDKQALKGIILGENMSANNRDTIIRLMSHLQGYDIRWAQATKDLQRKEISVREITEEVAGTVDS